MLYKPIIRNLILNILDFLDHNLLKSAGCFYELVISDYNITTLEERLL